MSFNNLKNKQDELKQRLSQHNNPIVEFKRYNKVKQYHKFISSPIVYVLMTSVFEVIYVGRATRSLSEAFSKMAELSESEILEIFPFTRDDAADAFKKRLIYYFQPKFNFIRKEF